MNIDFIPKNFLRFLAPIEAIVGSQPVSISLVGSYGNPNKQPTNASDLDIIFVFDVKSAFRIYHKILSDLHKIENLEIVELGVHFQYGFVLSIYYHDNPLCWVDVGIMDVIFSKNYLVNLPRKDVFGKIEGSEIKQNPLHQMNHLARKILKSKNDAHMLSVDAACYRYLGWLKVYSEMQVNKNNPNEETLEIINLFRPGKYKIEKEEVVKLVLKDIGIRYPYMVETSLA